MLCDRSTTVVADAKAVLSKILHASDAVKRAMESEANAHANRPNGEKVNLRGINEEKRAIMLRVRHKLERFSNSKKYENRTLCVLQSVPM